MISVRTLEPRSEILKNLSKDVTLLKNFAPDFARKYTGKIKKKILKVYPLFVEKARKKSQIVHTCVIFPKKPETIRGGSSKHTKYVFLSHPNSFQTPLSFYEHSRVFLLFLREPCYTYCVYVYR